MRFTWDRNKSAINLQRHGIAFKDATRIFDGPTVEREDDRFEYGETRVYAIGVVNRLEITVIYTDRNDDERHIISAWRAEPHERRYSGKTSKAEPVTDWNRLRAITDDAVHTAIANDPDVNPTDEDFWKDARVVMPKPKETVTIRLDADLLTWFRSERGYQTKINSISEPI